MAKLTFVYFVTLLSIVRASPLYLGQLVSVVPGGHALASNDVSVDATDAVSTSDADHTTITISDVCEGHIANVYCIAELSSSSSVENSLQSESNNGDSDNSYLAANSCENESDSSFCEYEYDSNNDDSDNFDGNSDNEFERDNPFLSILFFFFYIPIVYSGDTNSSRRHISTVSEGVPNSSTDNETGASTIDEESNLPTYDPGVAPPSYDDCSIATLEVID